MSPEGRFKHILRRWLSVAMLAAATFALTLTAWWLQRSRINSTEAPAAWVIAVVLAAGVSATVLWLGPRRFVASVGLRHGVVFPPYWLGVALGVAASLAFVLISREVRAALELDPSNVRQVRELMLAFAGIPATVIVLSIVGHGLTSTHRRRRPTEPPATTDEDGWLLSDTPVRYPNDDRLNYSESARRIGQRLLLESQPAQAVLGRLGSGKTTLRNLTETYVASQPSKQPLEFVNIELWPFETSHAAVEGILRMLVEALSREVSTSRLNRLPGAYAEAVATASGLRRWLPQSPSHSRTPLDVLHEIDEIATIIGRRYVLWVEDLERFAFGDPSAETVVPAELERLAPIRALLFGLDSSRSITVVTATTTLFQRFDLDKIARYVERIPDLPIRTAQRIIAQFRKRWLASSAVIDPGSLHRNDFGWHDIAEDEEGTFSWVAPGIYTPASAIASLASTPRVLKQGLRRAYETWQALAGEIDLDDTIAMCVLREASPSAFALVERHVDRLRGQMTPSRRDSQPLNEFSAELATLNLDSRTVDAVMVLVKAIFEKHGRRPQGLRYCHHADYWHRFLVLPAIPEAKRDQRILKVLVGESDDEILGLLANAELSDAVEDFARVIAPERLQGFFAKFVTVHLDDDPGKWPGGLTGSTTPPGLIPLWRMIRDRMGVLDLDRLATDVEQGLELTAPRNLPLMEQIQHWMLASSPELVDLFPDPTLASLKSRGRQLLWRTYDGHPEKLAAALQNASQFTLYWLCWGLDRIRARQDKGLPFAEWPTFSKTVLAAMDAVPRAMIPQIAPLVVRDVRSIEGPDQLRIDRDQCSELFGDADDLIRRARALSFDKADPWVEALRNGTASVARSRSEPDLATADASTEVAKASGEGRSAPRRITALVEGFWFDHRDDINPTRPTYSPTGAVLPERTRALEKESICIDMVAIEDSWLPLSEAGIYTYSHSMTLANQREYFFVPVATWPKTYVAKLHGTIEHGDIADRFGPEVAALARQDKASILLRLVEV